MIVIFGKDGQVGRALARLASPQPGWHFIGRDSVDLSDQSALKAFLATQKPAGIINAAAYTAVDRAESEPDQAVAVNAKAPGTMAAYCKAHNIPFLHISTDYVFDGTKDSPYVENDPVCPLSVYGESKAAGEAAILALGGQNIILRTSWVYAPEGRNFVSTMLHLGQKNKTLRIVCDQIGAPTSAHAIAHAILEIWPGLEKSAPDDPVKTGLFHMTAQGWTSWHGFAEEIFNYAGRRGLKTPDTLEPIPSSAYETPATRPLNSRLDCSKLRDHYGVELPPWQKSLRACLDEIFENTSHTQDSPAKQEAI